MRSWSLHISEHLFFVEKVFSKATRATLKSRAFRVVFSEQMKFQQMFLMKRIY